MSLFTLTTASHFFKLSSLSPRAKSIALEFARRFVRYKVEKQPNGRFLPTMVNVYAASTADRSEFRFHINTIDDFREFIKQRYITPELFTEDKKELLPATDIDLIIKPEWTLRENQIDLFKYLMDTEANPKKFVGAQTGFGKSLLGTKACIENGKRIVVIVRAMYVQKWVDDFKKYSNSEADDIVVIRGSASLQALLMLAENKELKAKIIIISSTTMQGWIKDYELSEKETLDAGYACLPEDFFNHIGAGIRMIDEVHLEFHLFFKIDMYTNVAKSISLSATLLNNDKFLETIYQVAYPPKDRYQTLGLDRYIDSFAFLYHIKTYRKFNTTEYGSHNYSHGAFEKSILRDKDFTANYLALIQHIVNIGYIETYKPTQKFAVFCSSIKMCTVVTDFLKAQYPKLDVRRYVEDDPYENLLDADIRVTTVLSGGTAHDVANLVGVLLTISLSSIQANIQVLGRLRKLPDVTPRFYYFSSLDIPKHLKFHEEKVRMLKERARNVKVLIAASAI